MDMTLPNGMTISTYSPPSGFDPLHASDAELVKAGFPPRPTDPRILDRYNRVLTSLKGKLNYITPTFRYEENIVHGPRRRIADAGTETSTNWSGGVVYAPPGESFYWVNGDWVIPAVDAPTENQWYYCASWVGIDGDRSDDVCQAGIESAVYRSGNSITTQYYAWTEWYPAASVAITNFPVSPGDMVTCLICTSGAGATSAQVYFSNRTTGVTTSLNFTAPTQPTRTSLIGNCAEWVVEAPQINGEQSAMADYGQVFFNECLSVAEQPTAATLVDGGTGDNIDLYVNPANPDTEVSEGILVSATVVECLYVGTLP